MKQDSLSVIVPAFNEEKNLRVTVEDLLQHLPLEFQDFEILLIDDGSTDRTNDIAEDLRKQFPERIKVFRNAINSGLGYSYCLGLQCATKTHVILCPGDNENSAESILAICRHRQYADIVIPYPLNPQIRPLFRRITSRLYVAIVNFLSGHTLLYYNGTVLHTTRIVQGLSVQSRGFGYQSEILTKLLSSGYSYVEVPFLLNSSSGARKSVAFHWKNLFSVAKTLLHIRGSNLSNSAKGDLANS